MTYKIRKVGGDKIALLSLFVLSLLIARIIVVSKSAILLSEPIQLSRSGLSVSMPEGNGWESEKQWGFLRNGFALRSVFTFGSRRPTAEARCVYLLDNQISNPQTLFEQKAFEAEGQIVKMDQITKETLTFDWVQIENPQKSLIIIYGTAKLPQNHRFDIEVKQIMNDPWMAERAFKKIIDNLNYEGSLIVETGDRIITQIENEEIIVSFEDRRQG